MASRTTKEIASKQQPMLRRTSAAAFTALCLSIAGLARLPAQATEAVTTLITDYSDNCITEFDSDGKQIAKWTKVFGAWDATALANGNLLVVEFSISRVSERTREGKVVWQYENLKNPYCAQRLKNGNTLIANTFASEVIEVTPGGEVAWRYDDNIRPFDA